MTGGSNVHGTTAAGARARRGGGDARRRLRVLRAGEGSERTGGPVPWFCNPVAPNSVTGPGMGTVNFYAGLTARRSTTPPAGGRAQLRPGQGVRRAVPDPRRRRGRRVHAARSASSPAWAPTTAGASITPAMLADPNFDRDNPVIPGSNIDGVFDPTSPSSSSTTATPDAGAGRHVVLRAHRQRAAARRVPRQQRLVAPPPDAVLPPGHGPGVRRQHDATRRAPARAASTCTCTTTTCCTSGWSTTSSTTTTSTRRCTRASRAAGAIFDMNDPCHHSAMPMTAHAM